MRHSAITLTMDTYGHLLPDQHADAIGGMATMMGVQMPLAATGTADPTPAVTAVETAVGVQNCTSGCNEVRTIANEDDEQNTLEFPIKSKVLPAEKDTGPARIRTENQ